MKSNFPNNSYFDLLVKEALKLISINSVQDEAEEGAPFGRGNLLVLESILRLAEDYGFTVKNLDGYCGWAEIGEGKLFAVLGHLDTVPIGEGWTKNPMGEVSDGVLYGRGVIDDKTPVLACLIAAKKLLDEGLTPTCRLRFIFGCNEESGWNCIRRYSETEEAPECGFTPDADFPVIFAEKGIVDYRITLPCRKDITIAAGDRSNVVPNACNATIGDLNLSTKGKSAHGAHPYLGENAAVKMLSLLSAEDASFSRLYRAFYDCYGVGCGLDLHDDESGDLTLNLGVLRAEGGNVHATLNIRYPVTKLEEYVAEQLAVLFPDAQIERTHGHAPLLVAKEQDLVKNLLDAYITVTGQLAEPISIGGGTYARAIPCGVAFGPQLPNKNYHIHEPDEGVPLDDLQQIFSIYELAIRRLCFN